uniref:sushi, nidogen and EGF-like domain-containing protein 1 isoform X1 n=2 Tax=Styela clava TaxID=7725 RepID=UPI0019397BC0|nr:sushi, nidogen and EGF-like domain-containing protein 1 isoform X1 [Styela clava]
MVQYFTFVLSTLFCVISFSSAFDGGVCYRQTDRDTYKVSCTCFGKKATWEACTETTNELKVEPNGEICFEYSNNEANMMGCRCPPKGLTLYSDYKATTVSLQKRPSGGTCLAFFNDVRKRMECNCDLEGVDPSRFKKSTLEVITGPPQRSGFLPGEAMEGGQATGLCFREKNRNTGKQICICYGIAASASTCGLDIMEMLLKPPGGVCFEQTNFLTRKAECICPLFGISFDSCKRTTLIIGEPIPPAVPTRGPTIPSITVRQRPKFVLGNIQCNPDPCKNNGECNPVPNSNDFFCRCRERFHGKYCEKSDFLLPITMRNPCLPNPCRNQGTCSRVVGSQKHTCTCKRGYGGVKCEKTISTSQLFANGRTLFTRPKKGQYLCFPNPCQNSGICYRQRSAQGKYNKLFCKCRNAYVGEYCEFRKSLANPCRPNPCKNRGTCVRKADGKYKCKCKNNFKGKHCRARPDPCVPNPCSSKTLCVPLQKGHLCISTKQLQSIG